MHVGFPRIPIFAKKCLAKIKCSDGGPLQLNCCDDAVLILTDGLLTVFVCICCVQPIKADDLLTAFGCVWGGGEKYRWSELSKQTDGQKRGGSCCKGGSGGGVSPLFVVESCYYW